MKIRFAIAAGLLVFICVQSAPAESQQKDDDLASLCPGMAKYQKAHPHPDPRAPILDDPSARNPQLRRHLLEMYAADEAAGSAFALEVDKDTPDPAVMQRLKQVRADNLSALKKILATKGFPSKLDVGDDGVWAAFTLVQHADGDHELQKQVLAQMESLFKRHEIQGALLAYVTDRTRIADGQPQVYGTQFHLVNGDALEIRPFVDPQNLDKRRKDVDLPTEEDYMCYTHVRSGKVVRLPQ